MKLNIWRFHIKNRKIDETDIVLNNQNTTSTEAKKITNRVQLWGGGGGPGHIFTQRLFKWGGGYLKWIPRFFICNEHTVYLGAISNSIVRKRGIFSS